MLLSVEIPWSLSQEPEIVVLVLVAFVRPESPWTVVRMIGLGFDFEMFVIHFAGKFLLIQLILSVILESP